MTDAPFTATHRETLMKLAEPCNSYLHEQEAIAAALAEIDRLRADYDDAKAEIDRLRAYSRELRDEIDRLRDVIRTIAGFVPEGVWQRQELEAAMKPPTETP